MDIMEIFLHIYILKKWILYIIHIQIQIFEGSVKICFFFYLVKYYLSVGMQVLCLIKQELFFLLWLIIISTLSNLSVTALTNNTQKFFIKSKKSSNLCLASTELLKLSGFNKILEIIFVIEFFFLIFWNAKCTCYYRIAHMRAYRKLAVC